MKFFNATYSALLLIVFLYCFSAVAAAQSVRAADVGGARVQPSTATLPAGTLAVVNDKPITLSDIDPKIREMVENLSTELARARRSVLDNRINSLLIEAAAKKKNMLAWQLYDAEVTSRIITPSDQDIKSFYETNREQMGTAELDAERPQIIAYLKSQQEQRLSSELTGRLRAATSVRITEANPSAAQFAPGTPLATVGGEVITAGSIAEQLKPVLYKVRFNAYQIEKTGVDKAIDDLLLLAEAQRLNIGPEEIIRKEITDQLHHPTDADITKYFEENKTHITGPLEVHRVEIARYLEQEEQVKRERALSDKLRAGARIRLLLTEPAAPVLSISTAGSPSRGDVNAAVTIVEFTDFQCPACGKMYPVIEETLKPYGNRVRFVIRNFPLDQHAYARKAAEAAMESQAQGKFFQYIDQLFTHQESLDISSLKKYATIVGMNRARFDAALDRGEHSAQVRHDMEDGKIYGIDSTPTLFVNGVRIRELSDTGIKAAIDEALVSAVQSSKPPAQTVR